MIKRKLKDIERMVKGNGLDEKGESFWIEGVSIDTRSIKTNQLYIPIKGERFNGHDFIEEAIKKGAAAALWSKDEPTKTKDFPLIFVDDTLLAIQELARQYRKELPVKVIGITGSNGKTSTKDILASILKTKYKTHKTLGNLNNHLGVPLTLLQMKEDAEVAVIEMGMSALGEIETLSNIALPDIGVITNSTNVHINTLGSVENILKAKLEIVSGLKEDGLLVYLGDSLPLHKGVEGLNLTQRKETFGTKLNNDYAVEFTSLNKKGICFELKKPVCRNFFLSMFGKNQVYNGAAAIAVARYLNVPYNLIEKGLSMVDSTGMRNELIHSAGFDILNDVYKSNPISLRAALETIYSFKGYNKKIVVLGDMIGTGENEVGIHEKIGEDIRSDEIDYVFTIGKLAEHIAVKAKIRLGDNKVFSFNKKKDLLKNLKEVINKDTIILVKGSRGLHLEEVVDNLKDFTPIIS
ncbi:UDP-N-acetylmuramoyl-tripeptide--D-alanyl-D-alanine ligase [Maledivibacter halophilus]|uniref:UDP-N-acetylmuramoyl-tripeptide--D-alanyl-D-alanine ligase n=1 Tax=Maledivibacter halophilus TaxID=36842 RepID=A0A1T5INA2_9FIRM|nr:UDP-N-acetylmuramoyl-tripeptide--D-alanyl-D-alanine ligase [Maledivibacter halophilus]SKC40508.1 UDP-N-acetylmuramoyl-tripeptide--D-alanyl-D-alanine ligase [Maledivibacter halophilus]